MPPASRRPAPRALMLALFLPLLAACQWTGPLSTRGQPVNDVAEVGRALDAIDAARVEVPTLTGIGHASISVQPASNPNQRRLLAIRAARLAAMQDLTEQVHGLRVKGRTTVVDTIVQNDTLRASVDGTIRGARTVRINPVGGDTYEVVLELDRDLVSRIVKGAR